MGASMVLGCTPAGAAARLLELFLAIGVVRLAHRLLNVGQAETLTQGARQRIG